VCVLRASEITNLRDVEPLLELDPDVWTEAIADCQAQPAQRIRETIAAQ
jgi:hypothetical protein